jgi:glycosyltransferase involved in cell wall biosynthesis
VALSPLISVVVPSYEAAGKLRETVESVLAQRFADLECLVVDGGSGDGTLDEIRRFSGDLRLRWWSEPDRGIYDAMNKGVRASVGEFIYFLGAGDLLRPDALTRISVELQSDAPPDFLYGDVFWADRALRYDGAFTKYKLLRKNICHQAIFFHRSLFSRLGEYDLQFPTLADYAFNLRCFGDRATRKRYVPFIVADYEGGGVTARNANPDPYFASMFGVIIRREFGPAFHFVHVHYDEIERILASIRGLVARVCRHLGLPGKVLGCQKGTLGSL